MSLLYPQTSIRLDYEEVKVCIRTKYNTDHTLHITSVARRDNTPLQTLLYIGTKLQLCVDIYASAYSDTAIFIAKEMSKCKIKSSSCTYTRNFL